MNTSPETSSTEGIITKLKNDFPASVVVFLVALPLCMGIAIASGVPVSAGLLTGIIGGLLVGLIAGAPLQVSGPAAGLTVIVYSVVQQHGLEMLGTVVLIGGMFQLLAGVLKLGQWFRAVSPAVIKGMLSGIGVLIFASQFHVMVDDKPKEGGLKNLISIPEAIAKGLPLPEWTDAEERKIRKQHLIAFGDLHEQQVQLYEKVAEQAVDNPQEDDIERELLQFEEIAKQQSGITEELEQLEEEVRNFEFTHSSVQKQKELASRMSKALVASQTARDDLTDESKLAEVKDDQKAAAESMANLMSSLKNHRWAAKVGIFTIGVILIWSSLVPKRFRVVPPPLIAVVGATVLATIYSLPVFYVEIPDNLFSEIHFPSWIVLQNAPWLSLIQSGLLIAVVASAETLLCAVAVDQMHSGPRTKYDRELTAQGIGNMACGFVGALPMTGVIVRSAANVQAGGKTRWSAVMHGLWLLIFVALLGWLLRSIPTACLAAMLVYTGIKLMNFPKNMRDLKKYGYGEIAIYVVTVSTIVSVDLLSGVLAGIGLSAFKLLYTFSHLKTDLTVDPENKKAHLLLNGAATFLRLPLLAEELDRVPKGFELRVDFQHLDYIDHACLDLLMNWGKQHESLGGGLTIDWESLNARFHREENMKSKAGNTNQPDKLAS
ncbi:MAG: SulP family inorganic anion transporter [Planctomycetaceae bacterium]|nr:SulP family inorganic anion transporter [Planctomycetaceae bacterium]